MTHTGCHAARPDINVTKNCLLNRSLSRRLENINASVAAFAGIQQSSIRRLSVDDLQVGCQLHLFGHRCLFRGPGDCPNKNRLIWENHKCEIRMAASVFCYQLGVNTSSFCAIQMMKIILQHFRKFFSRFICSRVTTDTWCVKRCLLSNQMKFIRHK